MGEIYARDLNKDKQTDEFMGKGFKSMLKKANEEGKELVIGTFLLNKEWYIK